MMLLSVTETQGLTISKRRGYPSNVFRARSPVEKMVGQSCSYCYYYYYGPLSAGRDGRAMGCREVIS